MRNRSGRIAKGPKKIRVLEGRFQPVVAGEVVPRAGQQIEIADDADDRGDDSRDDVGIPHDFDPPHRVMREQAGEQHRREAHIDRDDHESDCVAVVHERDQRNQSADIPEYQQKKRQQDFAVDGDAGENARKAEHRHQSLIGRGLDHHVRAREDRHEQRKMQEARREL